MNGCFGILLHEGIAVVAKGHWMWQNSVHALIFVHPCSPKWTFSLKPTLTLPLNFHFQVPSNKRLWWWTDALIVKHAWSSSLQGPSLGAAWMDWTQSKSKCYSILSYPRADTPSKWFMFYGQHFHFNLNNGLFNTLLIVYDYIYFEYDLLFFFSSMHSFDEDMCPPSYPTYASLVFFFGWITYASLSVYFYCLSI